jgi:SAM-dependent methyltransferase
MSTEKPASPLASPEPWDLVAEGYVAENLPAFEAFAAEALRRLPAVGDVLDVAAGPGSLTLLAARTAREVTAVDFSPAMLAVLKRRAEAAGVRNVEARLGDGQALDLPDQSFDAAYSMFGLIFFPDPGRGLRELRRVLRPGAQALIATWMPFERSPTIGAIFAAMKAELPESGIGERPLVLATPDEIRAAYAAAGFATSEVHEYAVSLPPTTAAEAWRSFTRGGAPAVLLRKKIGEAAFAALSERIVRRMEQALGVGPTEVRFMALLGVGTR